MASLRFGPNPPDLPLADASVKEIRSGRLHRDFRVVRFRVAGGWVLGVLRSWRFLRGGAIQVQIEAVSPLAPDARVVWYRFIPESVDPLHIDGQTGELRIAPPGERGAVGHDRI